MAPSRSSSPSMSRIPATLTASPQNSYPTRFSPSTPRIPGASNTIQQNSFANGDPQDHSQLQHAAISQSFAPNLASSAQLQDGTYQPFQYSTADAPNPMNSNASNAQGGADNHFNSTPAESSIPDHIFNEAIGYEESQMSVPYGFGQQNLQPTQHQVQSTYQDELGNYQQDHPSSPTQRNQVTSANELHNSEPASPRQSRQHRRPTADTPADEWFLPEPSRIYTGPVIDLDAFREARNARPRQPGVPSEDGLDQDALDELVDQVKPFVNHIYDAIYQTESVCDMETMDGKPAQAVRSIQDGHWDDDVIWMASWKIVFDWFDKSHGAALGGHVNQPRVPTANDSSTSIRVPSVETEEFGDADDHFKMIHRCIYLWKSVAKNWLDIELQNFQFKLVSAPKSLFNGKMRELRNNLKRRPDYAQSNAPEVPTAQKSKTTKSVSRKRARVADDDVASSSPPAYRSSTSFRNGNRNLPGVASGRGEHRKSMRNDTVRPASMLSSRPRTPSRSLETGDVEAFGSNNNQSIRPGRAGTRDHESRLMMAPVKSQQRVGHSGNNHMQQYHGNNQQIGYNTPTGDTFQQTRGNIIHQDWNIGTFNQHLPPQPLSQQNSGNGYRENSKQSRRSGPQQLPDLGNQGFASNTQAYNPARNTDFGSGLAEERKDLSDPALNDYLMTIFDLQEKAQKGL